MSPSRIPDRLRGAASCPLCGNAASAEHAPFCSRGCRDRDLLKWLGEGYRIAGRPTDPEEAADATDD